MLFRNVRGGGRKGTSKEKGGSRASGTGIEPNGFGQEGISGRGRRKGWKKHERL